MDRFLTTHDAAVMIGVHPITIGRWMDKGLINATRTVGGHRRVRATALHRFLTEQGMEVPPELEAASPKVKLLVVDDEKLVLNGIRRAFRPWAAEVELSMTTSGVQALLMLTSELPDALLIDLSMPDLDGFEVCRRVRAFAPLSKVKLVAMSSITQPGIVEKAKEAGALGCLVKPINPGEILGLVRGKLGMPITNRALLSLR